MRRTYAALLAGALLLTLLTGCQAPLSGPPDGGSSVSQGEPAASLPAPGGTDSSREEDARSGSPAGSEPAGPEQPEDPPQADPAVSQEEPGQEDPAPSQEEPKLEEPAPSQEEPGQEDPAPSQEEPAQEEPAPSQEPEPAAPPSNHTLHVLMYHSVVEGDGSGCNDWMTTTQHLREDLQWLKDHGYTTLLPSELAAGTPLPERAVLITFDDGYADNYRLAYPILQEFQAKAVISMIVRRTAEGKPDFLTWDMCREMAASGLVEFGSHTYDLHAESPRGIQRLAGESREGYEARVFADIGESVRLIEENVGQKVCFFAYPHGQTESWASDYLREHFALSVTTRHGAASISKGLYDLPRYNINTKQPASKFLPD